jgi:hypothetical protein
MSSVSSVTTIPRRRAKFMAKEQNVPNKQGKRSCKIVDSAEKIKTIELKERRRNQLAVKIVSYLFFSNDVIQRKLTKQASQASLDEPPMVQPLQLRAAK